MEKATRLKSLRSGKDVELKDNALLQGWAARPQEQLKSYFSTTGILYCNLWIGTAFYHKNKTITNSEIQFLRRHDMNFRWLFADFNKEKS